MQEEISVPISSYPVYSFSFDEARMQWTITKEQSVGEALQERYQESSKTTLRSWIAQGRVWVGAESCRKMEHKLIPGDLLVIDKKRQFLWNGIEILYQDEHIIVIYKPAGLLSVATDDGVEDHAHACLKRAIPRRTIYPVHRLDRDVSGVLVFAFSPQAEEGLKEQFAAHTSKREYRAIVEGVIDEERGTWDSYLCEEENCYVHSVRDPAKGKLAITHYEVLKRSSKYSVLCVHLETGRKNQIRVHAAEAGFPIVGDRKYGAKSDFHGRIALQAYQLCIEHPIIHRAMTFTRRVDEVFLIVP